MPVARAGIVLPILVIIACLPMGLEVAWEPGNFRLYGSVWFVPFRLVRHREPQSGPSGGAAQKQRRRFSWEEGKILVKNGYTTLCRLVSRVRVERLELRFTAAGSEPAKGALLYAAAGTALEGLAHVCEGRVPHTAFSAGVDFECEHPGYDGRILLSLPLWRAAVMSIQFGWGILRDYHRLKKGE